MSKKVLVPIADGSEEIEAVCIIDTLRRAGADVTVASVSGGTIEASRGVVIVADSLIGDCAGLEYDLIALPGGMPGSEHLRDSEVLKDMLLKQKDAGRMYAAICAAPAVVLEPFGLLGGKKATCYPTMMDQLTCETLDQEVVVDGNCVTSQGPGTALRFAVRLVEELMGKDKAHEVGKGLLLR